MGILDIILLALIGFGAAMAVRSSLRRKKNGCSGCCGNCSSCGTCAKIGETPAASNIKIKRI